VIELKSNTDAPQSSAISDNTAEADHYQISNDERIFLERLKEGDSASFEQLIREHGGYLMTITRRYLQSEADVQDRVQIAVNSALMKIRSQGRRMEDLVDDSASLFDEKGKRIESEPEIGESVEDEAIDNETRKAVRGYIEKLPELPRNLLLLRDIEGYSTEETAEQLAISVASVKTGLHRARKSLKKLIEQNRT